MTAGKVIDRLMGFAPPVLEAHCKRGVGRCILATAVGIEVLRAFEIEAAPLVVHTRMANARYVAAVARGADPVAAIAGGGHLLVSAGASAAADGWGAHLMIAIPRRAALLDLDQQQFRRPQHGIHLDAAGLFAWPIGTRHREFTSREGVRVVIDVVDDDRYRTSKDWSDATRHRPMVKTITHAIRSGTLR